MNTGTTSRQAKVLVIVEDDPDLQMLVRLKFDRDVDFQVGGTASTIAAAIELARRDQPDLIVLDNHLDDQMTGLEGAPLLKEVVPDSVIVMFSASEEARIPAMDSPSIDGFVLKTEIGRLVQTCRDLLGL